MRISRCLRLSPLLLSSLLACSDGEAPEAAPADEPPAGEPVARQQSLVTAGTELVGLPATRDTSIRLSAQNQNFGNMPDLDVNRALVGFDAVALAAAIGPTDRLVSARLELTLASNELRRRAPTKTVTAHRLTKSWTEAGATWNCAVDATPSNQRKDCSGVTAWSMGPPAPNPFIATPTASTTIAPQQTGVVGFDVTADVHGFLSGSLANHGWMLKSGLVGEFAEFASRQSASPPRLVLTVQRCSASLCDDGNACTVDSCSEQATCLHNPAPTGSSCDDGNSCTRGDQCGGAGVCLPGAVDVCAATMITVNEIESNGGTPGDWVELFNKGASVVDLSGWIFKDNDETHVYTIPTGTQIQPGAYLVLDENTNFAFGLGGADSARLFLSDGTPVDSHSWTAHAPVTYGRCPNGTGAFTSNLSSSKGAANDCSVPLPPVVINEIESNGGTPGDWVELFNKGTAAVDVSGWIFKDNDETHVYTVPTGTSIAAGAYLVLDENTNFTFGLGTADSARLFLGDGTPVDSHSWTAHAPVTYGRCPNGTGAFTSNPSSSKAAANDCSVPLPPVVINEIESNGGTPGDWVELFNKGAAAVDVSGWTFKDNDDTHLYTVPSGTSIAAGAYLVLDENTNFSFGLGAGDNARLFLADGTTLVDSHTWTAHASTTYGRCPNGTGTFATTVASSKGATNQCSGGPGLTFSPWPGDSAVSTVDAAATFATNLSGLTYQPASAGGPVLWAVQNGPSVLYRLVFDGTNFVHTTADGWAAGKTLTYPGGTGQPDSEGVTKADPAAPAIYVATERDNSVGGVSRLSVLRFDTSVAGTTLTATHEWNLTASLPAVGSNLGLEAITFVPDAQLVTAGFRDEFTGATYNPAGYPANGGGVFFVGVEGSGIIYGFVLDHAAGTFRRVAEIASGQAAVMGIEFDRDSGNLWAYCDNTCGNRATLLGITAASAGRFVVLAGYERPAGLPDVNNEGIAFAPLSECTAGMRSIYFSDDDDTGGHALRRGSLTCGPLP